MNLFTKSLLLAALLPAAASAAVVPNPTDPPVTITVTYENGTLTTNGTTTDYAQTWTTKDTKTGLVIDFGANNALKTGTGGLQVCPGKSGSCNFNMTVGQGWFISAYSFTATTADGNKTVTAQGQQHTLNASTPAEVSVELTEDDDVSLVYAGNNTPATFANFTVTVTPCDPNDPVLKVDPAPAAEGDVMMVPTNIVDNDHFNIFTTWYHILDGKHYLTGATLTDAGPEAENVFTDEYLYCAIKTDAGYALYNKAAGFAAPVAGANLTATALTINGAEVTPRFAEKFCSVKVAEGKMTRTDGTTSNSAWQGTWTSNAKPTVTFFGSLNNLSCTLNPTDSNSRTGNFKLESGSNGSAGNFTWSFGATDGNVVAAFNFLAKKEAETSSASTVTPKGGTAVSMTDYWTRISGSGYDDANMASFVLNAVNNNGILMSDCYVTVRRSQMPYNTRAGYKIFPNQGTERRIPAIARVFEGDKAGRLVAIFDLRHHGGDVGFYGNISLEISTSDDNGATWSQPDYLRNAAGEAVTTPPADIWRDKLPMADAKKDPNKYWNYAFGDAALVADRESGKLLLMAVGGPVSLWQSRYDKPMQSVRWISEDGGTSWTDAQRVTYDIYDLFNGEPVYGKIDGFFIGSGRIFQSRYIKVGDYYRVYAVLASQNNGEQPTTRNWVIYSDDFGQNWAVLGGTDVCPTAIGDGDECKAEELPDGSLVMAGRRRTGNRNFNIFRYTDATAAKGHWLGQVVTDMGFGSINATDGEIMILPAIDNTNEEPVYLILQSFPYGGGRNYVSIAYKAIRTGEDMVDASMFTHFEGRYRISSGASVYSTMAWQANNKLAFFWEEGSPISGAYLDLSLEEITDERYSYKPDEGNKLAIQMTKELLNYRAENDNFESRYVGHPIRSKALFEEKVDDYYAKPSYQTYVAANKLEYEGNGNIEVVDGGEYRLESGHGNTYNFSGSWYLASDGTNLTTTNDDSGENSLFKVAAVAASRADEATPSFTLLNKHHNKYVATVPANRSTKFTMADDDSAAGVFEISSRVSGHTVISGLGTDNTTYSSLHMDGSKNVVTWTRTANASRWFMELINAPEGYETPEASEPDFDDYDFDYDKNAPAEKGQSNISEAAVATRPGYYFDLQGRMVTKPLRGIFIAPNGKKVIL